MVVVKEQARWLISGRLNGEPNDGGKSTRLEQERRKGNAWTEDEHTSVNGNTFWLWNTSYIYYIW